MRWIEKLCRIQPCTSLIRNDPFVSLSIVCSQLHSRCCNDHKTETLQKHHRLDLFRTYSTTGSDSSPPSTSTQPENDDDDDLAIERMAKARRPKSKASPTASSSGSYPKVISATRDQVYGGGPLTPTQQFENAAISFLALLFFVILCEGVFLAATGFMSESLDQFAQDVVYPAFSPTLGFFLLCSSLYGLWKTGAGREDEKKQD